MFIYEYLDYDNYDKLFMSLLNYSLSKVETADADLTFVGDHDIHDLQRVCFEVQGTGFTLNATNNENRTGEQQMFVRTIDANTEGLFVRLKKNGASNYEEVQLA